MDQEFIEDVQDLLCSDAVQRLKLYVHHKSGTRFDHSLYVAYRSYRFAKKMGWDSRAAARGGLLHDLFLYDWHTYRPAKGELLHGFEHPRKALQNARKYFNLTPVEEDIILRHMWPLTRNLPATAEGRVVTMFDKYVSLMETFRVPVRISTPLAEL